jgi:hypothetical protein
VNFSQTTGVLGAVSDGVLAGLAQTNQRLQGARLFLACSHSGQLVGIYRASCAIDLFWLAYVH